MPSRLPLYLAAVAALLVPTSASALVRDAAQAEPYTLAARALLGPAQTDLHLSVTGNGVEPPAELGLVQVKVFAESGEHLRTETFHDVASPGGEAEVTLAGLEPKQVVEIKTHAKSGNQNNIEARAEVLRRPAGAVSSDVPEATQVGLDVLAGGGNAVDAAVAMEFALAVTQPHNVGLGGGMTAILHIEGKGDFAVDGRETSPIETDPNQYRANSRPDSGFKTNANSSGFIVGVPGSLKTAEVLLKNWGTKSLSDVLQPAIALAANGFTVGHGLDTATEPGRRCQNVGQPETKALFCNGAGLEKGTTFRNPDLANTFRLIAEQGTDVFYRGEIAAAIVQATRRNRVLDGSGVGKMTSEDMGAYGVDVEALVGTKYRDLDLRSVGGSSGGGYIALQVLRMLDLRRDDFPIGDVERGFGWMAPNTAHVLAEAMGLAFADYFYWMGGGASPGARLLADCYLGPRAERITLNARIARGLGVVPPRPTGDPFSCEAAPAVAEAAVDDESTDRMTSHFSVLDRWGNAVSFTATLTDAFGSGILVPGYGFLLNDAMSNFNPVPVARPGAFPGVGDPGTNDPGPRKRARGNTAPLIALDDGEAVLVTGSPGGSNIPSVVVNVVMNLLDHGMTLQDAVDRARMWFTMTRALWNRGPDGAPQIPQATLDHLGVLGHDVSSPQPFPNTGGAQSIAVDRKTFVASAAKDRLIPDATAVVLAN